MKRPDYDKLLATAIVNTPPSGIRRFFDIASEMKDCISLGVGEPDFPTPWAIREAGIKSLKDSHTCYTSNAGMIELRELVCKYYRERYNVDYPVDQVVVTVGASEGIDLAMRALLNPGDEVLVPEPSYVSYAPCVSFTGGKPVPIAANAECGYKLEAEQIKKHITPRTKAIILPYPNNPTGAIMTREEWIQALSALENTDIIAISDEIYSELTYGSEPHCAVASLPGMYERTITLNGFSKAFAMTGWRLGYAFAPKPIFDQMLKIHQLTLMCASTTSQDGGIEGLRSGFENDFSDVQKMKREYNRRRKFIYQSLNEIGLTCFEPMGAFYVFPSIQCTGMKSLEFCERLLQEQKVAVVHGNAFGASGEGFVRISYAYSMKHLEEALGRIANFVAVHRQKSVQAI